MGAHRVYSVATEEFNISRTKIRFPGFHFGNDLCYCYQVGLLALQFFGCFFFLKALLNTVFLTQLTALAPCVRFQLRSDVPQENVEKVLGLGVAAACLPLLQTIPKMFLK